MSGIVLVHDDGKQKYESVKIYSSEFLEVHPGYGLWDDEALQDFRENINHRIDELIAYRDSLDDKLTKVYVDYKGDPI